MSPILIVGFHRSGTSAIARAFHAAGLDLGGSLLGAEPANPHGHFEDLEAIELHDALLDSTGRTWKSTDHPNSPLSTAAVDQLRSYAARRDAPGRAWGVKDPRLCLFLGDWIQVAPMARVVVVIRRPDEAVRSLHMRHSRRYVDSRGVDPSDLDFWRDPDLGLRLWIHYHRRMLSSLDSARAHHLIDFSDRASADGAVATLVNRWSLELDATSIPSFDRELGSTSVPPLEVRSRALLRDATEIWTELQERIDSQEDRSAKSD